MTDQPPPTKKKSRLALWLTIAAVAAVVLTGGGVAAWQWRQTAGAADRVPTFTVAHGPMTISVTETGTISAQDQEVVKSHVEGNTTIIYLIDEGKHVKKGDLLVQLDDSDLKNKLVDQQIKVQNAEADMIQAKQAMAVAQNKAKSDVDQAELDYRFAKEDLNQYVNGQYPKDLKEAEVKKSLADQKLQNAEDTYKWSRKLHEDNYLSDNELKKDELSRNQADLDYKLAVQAINLLKDFTYKRKVAELKSDVKQTGMALERTRRSAQADVIKAEAHLRAEKLGYDRKKQRQQKYTDQIAKCRITAPTDGMVVYATTGGRRWGNDEPLHEGQQVRERQKLIKLPTASAMMAKVKVHESSLDKVKIGQHVRVTIGALPGEKFTGTVTKIAPLPDQQSVWLNPDLKVYDTRINLDGNLNDVRTGMSCRAEIMVDQYPRATYVPVQAVVRVGGTPTVYLKQSTGFEAHPVKIGLNNNRMVRVTDGLTEGQLVSLTPPLASGAAPPMKLTKAANKKDQQGEANGREGRATHHRHKKTAKGSGPASTDAHKSSSHAAPDAGDGGPAHTAASEPEARRHTDHQRTATAAAKTG